MQTCTAPPLSADEGCCFTPQPPPQPCGPSCPPVQIVGNHGCMPCSQNTVFLARRPPMCPTFISPVRGRCAPPPCCQPQMVCAPSGPPCCQPPVCTQPYMAAAPCYPPSCDAACSPQIASECAGSPCCPSPCECPSPCQCPPPCFSNYPSSCDSPPSFECCSPQFTLPPTPFNCLFKDFLVYAGAYGLHLDLCIDRGGKGLEDLLGSGYRCRELSDWLWGFTVGVENYQRDCGFFGHLDYSMAWGKMKSCKIPDRDLTHYLTQALIGYTFPLECGCAKWRLTPYIGYAYRSLSYDVCSFDCSYSSSYCYSDDDDCCFDNPQGDCCNAEEDCYSSYSNSYSKSCASSESRSYSRSLRYHNQFMPLGGRLDLCVGRCFSFAIDGHWDVTLDNTLSIGSLPNMRLKLNKKNGYTLEFPIRTRFFNCFELAIVPFYRHFVDGSSKIIRCQQTKQVCYDDLSTDCCADHDEEISYSSCQKICVPEQTNNESGFKLWVCLNF